MNQYTVIGLMSGTSLDGLDIVCANFTHKNGKWEFIIVCKESIEYDAAFKKKLKNTVHLNATDLLHFHNEFGTWLGKEVKKVIDKNKLSIDFIASHGHTVFHQPEIGLTYQIGSGQHLANASSQKVICDFRTNDVALGGQGAPLVPIGDRLLFNEYDACLNLGGISNISFEEHENRIAYDISPVNMLLNYLCAKIGKAYDKGGAIAQSGSLNKNLLNTLNALEYYQLPFPKSLGYEWFAKKVIPIIDNTKDTTENLLHTAVHHICDQISFSVKKIESDKTKLLITGGGAKNDFLIQTLRQKQVNHAEIIIPSEEIIDFKEALIFAFMGVLRDRNEINCLKSVTGAKFDSSSGVVFIPS
ncbi:anhydro-N-acetylmuramic acid kinase [Aquimarina sp. 2201CG1-2-11]|uniref:anhydro-N-acetylmuramic acid kinase n=1 Tax=Aquimarina discodermiae TaxID=3231043 RepID=UPI0034635F7B